MSVFTFHLWLRSYILTSHRSFLALFIDKCELLNSLQHWRIVVLFHEVKFWKPPYFAPSLGVSILRIHFAQIFESLKDSTKLHILPWDSWKLSQLCSSNYFSLFFLFFAVYSLPFSHSFSSPPLFLPFQWVHLPVCPYPHSQQQLICHFRAC